ncbi:hypothetical protein KIPB_008198, partial [Kipferlia bialata]
VLPLYDPALSAHIGASHWGLHSDQENEAGMERDVEAGHAPYTELTLLACNQLGPKASRRCRHLTPLLAQALAGAVLGGHVNLALTGVIATTLQGRDVRSVPQTSRVLLGTAQTVESMQRDTDTHTSVSDTYPRRQRVLTAIEDALGLRCSAPSICQSHPMDIPSDTEAPRVTDVEEQATAVLAYTSLKVNGYALPTDTGDAENSDSHGEREWERERERESAVLQALEERVVVIATYRPAISSLLCRLGLGLGETIAVRRADITAESEAVAELERERQERERQEEEAQASLLMSGFDSEGEGPVGSQETATQRVRSLAFGAAFASEGESESEASPYLSGSSYVRRHERDRERERERQRILRSRIITPQKTLRQQELEREREREREDSSCISELYPQVLVSSSAKLTKSSTPQVWMTPKDIGLFKNVTTPHRIYFSLDKTDKTDNADKTDNTETIGARSTETVERPITPTVSDVEGESEEDVERERETDDLGVLETLGGKREREGEGERDLKEAKRRRHP